MLKIPDADLTVWRNGCWLTPSEALILPWQPSAAAGWGVFETLAVWDGIPLETEAHLSRLREGIHRLGGGSPPTEPWAEACFEWGRRMAGDGWLKILWGAEEGCTIFGGRVSRSAAVGEVRALTLPWPKQRRGPFIGCKVTSWALPLAGWRYAREHGVDEGLFLDDRGHLAEAVASNLFVVDRSGLCTPPVSAAVLPGVTRQLIIDLARKAGLPVRQAVLRIPRLRKASEAFLTSSVQGVRALIEYDGRPTGGGKAGVWTTRLAAALTAMRSAR